MRILPVIYALFCLVFLTSCGNSSQKEAENVAEEPIENNNGQSSDNTGVILFFGNSLTAGYGLESSEAFPSLIQEKIDSLGLEYEVVNAGLSGETTAGGRNRIGWVLKQEVDVFVLELGANDGLRGIPVDETRRNLQAIIETVRAKNPNTQIILAGMQIPPNMGQDYTSRFKNIFPELAEENDIYLIPFLLKDVGGIEELNQADRIHPTAEGNKIMAETVWEVLEPVIRQE